MPALLPLLLLTRRFPLVMLLLTGFAACVLCAANGWVLETESEALHLAGAAGTGAVLALAGALFREGHPRHGWLAFILSFVLPPAIALALALLPATMIDIGSTVAASLLFLSVSAHIGGRRQAEFVWFNRVAVWEGLFCLLLVGVAGFGVITIEKALTVLFDLHEPGLVRLGLPLLLCLAGPVLWLSRLPALSAFVPGQSDRDFWARGLGLLGAWAVTPLLFVYAAILLAYMGRMLVLQEVPANVSGWMVLSFLVAGAANWLLLAGREERGIVRWFRRLWFALTLPPLALLVYAAFVRVDVYGVTPNRVVLMAGAIWGVALAVLFLLRRGDIRLIPALGAGVLALIAAGPLNLNALSAHDHAARLHAVLAAAGVDGEHKDRALTLEEHRIAMAALNVLTSTIGARSTVIDIFADFGIALEGGYYPFQVLETLGYQGSQEALKAEGDAVVETTVNIWLTRFSPLDLSATPIFLGDFTLPRERLDAMGPLQLGLAEDGLRIAGQDGDFATARLLDIEDWLIAERGISLSGRPIDFTYDGRAYRMLPNSILATRIERDGAITHRLRSFSVLLFAEDEPAPALQPTETTP